MKRLRPSGQEAPLLRIELLTRPAYDRAKLLGHAGVSASDFRQGRDLAIALNEFDRNIKLPQPCEGFLRHWAREHIAANNDLVYSCLTKLVENSFQSRKISVDVIDGGDAHGSPFTTDQNRLSGSTSTKTASCAISFESQYPIAPARKLVSAERLAAFRRN